MRHISKNKKNRATRETVIDASGKRLGRLASEAARFLMGKETPAFRKSENKGGVVSIKNASRLHVSSKKGKNKRYARYSGYPGGLRYERLREVAARKGYREIIRRAVRGMLPANSLRRERMKNLIINE